MRDPRAVALWLALSVCLACAAVPERIPVLDPNPVDFPDASLVDCRDLLEAPAGRRGFCFAGSDGRFHFEDGSRARFWGINVAKDAVFQPPEIIDQAVDAIARAGFNLVRLHHLDDEKGLLSARLAGSPNPIDPERLAEVDHWVAALKARGIYIYLDLLDFRTFREAEGIPRGEELGRGAKPYALFDDRIIRRQMEYARLLLFDHRNPHTGLSFAQDPAVCMVELCDENGLFHEERRLGALLSPYREQLVARWNAFLLGRWGSRAGLARAWATDARSVLRGHEDPARGSVELPGMGSGVADGLARLRERNAFFAAIHREYFARIVGFLRESGLRCPISAVTEPKSLPDLWASATGLDYIAVNHYFDHPYFRPEANWQLPAFFSGQSPLETGPAEDFPGAVGAARVAGKPLVLREWGICWPNEHRAAGMLAATAYACLQDVDVMLLFTFDTRLSSRKLDYFDVRRDPARWRLAPVGARAFLARQLASARGASATSYGPDEVFDPARGTLPLPLHSGARVTRMQTRFIEQSPAPAPAAPPSGPAFVSDTGEIVLDKSAGVLRISAQGLAVVAGPLASVGAVLCGAVQFEANCATGACVWQSLDGLPAGQSKRWTVSVVSTAHNTGQKVREHLRKPTQTILALDDVGKAPVVIPCSPGQGRTSVRVNGELLVRAAMRDGALELYAGTGIMYLHCSTPGVDIELPAASGRQGAFYDCRGELMPDRVSGPKFRWPQGAVLFSVK